MTTTLPYGSWPSPISARDVAAGSHPVEGGRFVGDEVWWVERMPAEGGRSAVRRASRVSGEPETLLPTPWDVRSRVHEYGGGAWTTTDDGVLYFVESSDQRVWTLALGEEPRALTPAEGRMRFADLSLQGGRLLAVRETHVVAPAIDPFADPADVPEAPGPRRDIVAIPLDGSAAEDAGALVSVVGGSDFLAYPRVSPDGTQLAWVAWNRPNMPWDGSELRFGPLTDEGTVEASRALAGGDAESIVQPEWTGPAELTFCTDRSGRWNLHRIDLSSPEGAIAYAPADADTGGPLWNLGIRWFAPLDDGRIVAVRTHGADSLVLLEGDRVQPLASEASSRVLLGAVRGSRVLLTGAGARTLGGLWELDLDAPGPRPVLVRGAADATPPAEWLPTARAVTVDGPHGPVHAFAYPPTNPDVAAPESEAPPYLVLAHGGPTSNVSGGAALEVAYFTSRGIGILDVNYGGSTGYGRAYRERLDGQWGVVDRDDVIAAASGIAEAGLADGARLAIRGGSAGGWTVLCALTAGDRFAAGISRYGVADLRALAADTHDFEASYLDRLVGPLPDAEQLYVDRSPLSHLQDFTTPMLIEQGLDDPVVPPAQSEAVRDALAARGIRHAYLAFEGESHGFRRADTLVAALEGELSFLGQVLGFTPPGVAVLPLD